MDLLSSPPTLFSTVNQSAGSVTNSISELTEEDQLAEEDLEK